MSVLNQLCELIAQRVGAAHPELDARPHPGGALTAPAFWLEVVNFPQRTTARKRDFQLRAVLLLSTGDTEEAVRQGREYMEDDLSAAIEGVRGDYDDLVDSVTCGTWAEDIETYQQLDQWAITCDITVMGRTT